MAFPYPPPASQGYSEKPQDTLASLSATAAPVTTPSASFLRTNPLLRPFSSAYDKIDAWRTKLDLPNPGTAENLTREVKMTHLTNFAFDGFKGDVMKTVSLANPFFQVGHSFSMGSQQSSPMGGGPAGVHPGSYNFTATYATQQAVMHGMLENTGQMNGRFNWAWRPEDVTKFQGLFSPSGSSQSMFTLEHDHLGRDYTFSLRTFNPSLPTGMGTYQASYLQSLTKTFALGCELTVNSPHPQLSEASLSYLLKWTGGDASKANEWIATGQVLPNGSLSSTYWQRLSDKVDAAAELIMLPDPRPAHRQAHATVGVRYEMRAAAVRAQVDSRGKISALMEHKLAPTIGLLMSGDVDHWKNTSKFGIGVTFESPIDEDQIAAANEAAAAGLKPPM